MVPGFTLPKLMSASFIDLAQHDSVINCDVTVALNIGSIILPGLMILQNFCFILVYKTHISCFIRGMASNYEPTGISIPCMARGASEFSNNVNFFG